VYFSMLQRPSQLVTVALRIAGDVNSVSTVSRELKKAVLSIDPALPIFDLAMLDDRLEAQLAPSRLVAAISTVCAGVALFLTAFGLFAVVAYDVSQRVHEMGVRMALGAQRGDVLRLVLREGLALTIVGLLCGVGLSLEGGNTLEAFLFGVTPFDPAIYATISGVLVGVALFACWIPARRATRLDPIAVLRGE
jgi:ABC-type antimicrobial peptide transport system permease subunit